MAQERTAGEPANRLRLSVVSLTQQVEDMVAVELASAGMPRQTSLCIPPCAHHRYLRAARKGPKRRGGSLAMLAENRHLDKGDHPP